MTILGMSGHGLIPRIKQHNWHDIKEDSHRPYKDMGVFVTKKGHDVGTYFQEGRLASNESNMTLNIFADVSRKTSVFKITNRIACDIPEVFSLLLRIEDFLAGQCLLEGLRRAAHFAVNIFINLRTDLCQSLACEMFPDVMASSRNFIQGSAIFPGFWS